MARKAGFFWPKKPAFLAKEAGFFIRKSRLFWPKKPALAKEAGSFGRRSRLWPKKPASLAEEAGFGQGSRLSGRRRSRLWPERSRLWLEGAGFGRRKPAPSLARKKPALAGLRRLLQAERAGLRRLTPALPGRRRKPASAKEAGFLWPSRPLPKEQLAAPSSFQGSSLLLPSSFKEAACCFRPPVRRPLGLRPPLRRPLGLRPPVRMQLAASVLLQEEPAYTGSAGLHRLKAGFGRRSRLTPAQSRLLPEEAGLHRLCRLLL